jgi:hypothetical protein
VEKNEIKRLQRKKTLAGENIGPLIPASASEAIFPLLAKHKDRDAVIGTGFYIGPDIFVTARHVLDEYVANNRLTQAIGAMHFSSSGRTTRSMAKGSLDGNFDLAVGAFQQMRKGSAALTNKILPLTARAPSVGEFAAVYAYPNHDFLIVDGKPALSLWPSTYSGRIVEYFEERGPSVKLKPPYYQTDLHLHPAASGAPVFDQFGKVWGVASSSYDGATDLSFITPIGAILGLTLELTVPPETAGRLVTIAELIHRKYVSYDSVIPSQFMRRAD